MIQRVQSVFLLLAGLFFGAQFLLPMATTSQKVAGFFGDMRFDIMDHVGLLITAIVGIVISLGAIFLFNNRPLQVRLGYLIISASILFVALAYYFISSDTVSAQSGYSFAAGAFMPIGSVVCAFLANYFIRKDENTVRSMDRLR